MESTLFSKRLGGLYANYFDAWRAVFGAPVASGTATPLDEREQRWEGEGGSLDPREAAPAEVKPRRNRPAKAIDAIAPGNGRQAWKKRRRPMTIFGPSRSGRCTIVKQ